MSDGPEPRPDPSAPARADNIDADIAAAGLVPCGECEGKGYLGDDPEEPCVMCGMTGFLRPAPAPRAGPAIDAEAEKMAADLAGGIDDYYLPMLSPILCRTPDVDRRSAVASLLRPLLAAWRAAEERAEKAERDLDAEVMETGMLTGARDSLAAEAEGLRARVVELEAAEEDKAVLRCATDLLRLVVRDYLGGMRGDDFDETIELARRMVESDDFKRAAGLGPAPREGET